MVTYICQRDRHNHHSIFCGMSNLIHASTWDTTRLSPFELINTLTSIHVPTRGANFSANLAALQIDTSIYALTQGTTRALYNRHH